MAVSFRVTGAWAELTADGSVAIPATPQAGDRLYLFARWKDFAITAQVTSPSGWTKLTEFADGSVTSGNGTGSVKVACWYRDWQSGDADPTIDFSTNPNNASAVIMVMAKASTETWLTPVAVTAAMTTWTTTSQTVSASSTAAVLGAGVVMGLIGIRDDTATMTRPTTGIDDSAGAVTWNGNYVESPATHHSTTTGDDGAADLGYRLVSAGATATLRMTGTISAAETGAALWVVQGIQVNLVVQNGAHAHTGENASLTQVHTLAPQNSSHAHSSPSLSLTQTHSLTVQNSSHAHTSNNLALTQVHALSVQASQHTHLVNTLTLTQVHGLAISSSTHNHTSGSLTLERIFNLTVQNGSHAHTVENVIIAQEHNLTVSDALHVHTAESPNVRTIAIIFLDPGGDAVGAIGYFNIITVTGSASATYDTSQHAVGVGSYRFEVNAVDSDSYAETTSILGQQGHCRVSFYFRYDLIPDSPTTILQGLDVDHLDLFRLVIVPEGDGVVVALQDEALTLYPGVIELLPETWNRISFSYIEHDLDDTDIKVYVNGVEEVSVTALPSGDTSPAIPYLRYGVILNPTIDSVCWFDQIYVDDGDDLADPGDILITAKLPATVNDNNWNATVGTGAINERPLSETNYQQHTASSGVRQTYTLQTAAVGDVDLTGNFIIGYMGWIWAKKGPGDDGDLPALIVNNTVQPIILTASPKLFRLPVTSSAYPSHAAGIGMRSNEEAADTFLYECGVVIAYRNAVSAVFQFEAMMLLSDV